jgi:hypothetical protein
MTNTRVCTGRLDLAPMTFELMEALQRGDRESAQAMTSYRIPGTGRWPSSRPCDSESPSRG